MIGSFIVLFLFGPYFFVVHLSLKNTSTFTHHGQPPPSPPILLRHHHPPSSLSSVIDDGTKRRFSAIQMIFTKASHNQPIDHEKKFC
jgi:hypothetical protein